VFIACILNGLNYRPTSRNGSIISELQNARTEEVVVKFEALCRNFFWRDCGKFLKTQVIRF